MNQPTGRPCRLSDKYARHYRDRVTLPNGTVGTWHRIVEPAGPCVIVVPVRPDGRLVVIEQYRHATARWLVEFPRGGADGRKDLRAVVRNELREETGYSVRAIRKVGRFRAAASLTPTVAHVFEARVGPDWGPVSREPGECIRRVRAVDPDAVPRLSRDAMTLAAYAVWRAARPR